MLNLIQHLILKEAESEVENIVVPVSNHPVSKKNQKKKGFKSFNF